jgi:hypothetical protein
VIEKLTGYAINLFFTTLLAVVPIVLKKYASQPQKPQTQSTELQQAEQISFMNSANLPF